MIARLPLLTLAVGLATGLVAAIVIANYSQQRREEYLRYLLTNILLFNLLILAGLAFHYLLIHAPESATTPASLVLLALLGVMALLKITWAYAFWMTTRQLHGKDTSKRLARALLVASGVVLAIFLTAAGTAWLLRRNMMLQTTITLFELAVIGSAVLSSVILWNRTRILPGGRRRTSLMVFSTYQGVLFGALLSLVFAGWAMPGPKSVGLLLANGAFLTLFNIFPPLWLKYFSPLPTSSFGLYNSLGISRRERQVAECLIEGLTNQEIADRLFISVATVKDHNHNLFRKCGVRNRVELVNLLRRAATG
jgi:DNA-binding CsgD family transcriptional regulator